MIYSGVLSAIVSALAAETIDNTSKQAWQKLYRPGHKDGLDLATLMRSGGQEGITRTDADCWVFARLHSQLIPRHWAALVAKYSTHKGRKIESIGKLAPLIASPAPFLFVQKAVAAWSIPPLKGAEGKRSTDMIVLPKSFYDMNGWDLDGRPEQTRRRWRLKIHEVLDEMVGEAVAAAAEILEREGVLIDMAA
ncbi:hypothetical protein ACUTAH_02770 [Metapseudomonas furukawaii]|uniref:hypothetical protein n=1 Tax=Metapseudomonas furukawaii TaxID=1149133 RepID=UPI00404672BB